jgi:hypothetical protein
MTILNQSKLRAIAGLLGVLAVAACGSDTTGTNRQQVQLSFTTNANTGAAASPMRMSSDITVGASNDLVLTKVQVVIGKIELNEEETTSCVAEIEDANDDHADVGEECEDVARDPILVDIPLDDAAHTVANVPLAQGTYSKLEAKLEPARAEATTFNAANPNLVGKSIRVEGTYKGAAFVFTSATRTSLEMEFSPPLVIDATSTNATISFDVRKWFLDSNGAAIDPNTATPGSSALQKIEDNVHRSFRAFEDDDKSGMDDHSEHRG